MKKIKYRVYNNRDNKDITNEFQWVITPDGKLHFVEIDDLPEAPSCAHYEIIIEEK